MLSRSRRAAGYFDRSLLQSLLVLATFLAPCVVPCGAGLAGAGTTYTISGDVRCGLFGFGISGIKMRGLPGDPKTNSSGRYSATVPEGWSGAVYPESSYLHFDPYGRKYSNVTSNIEHNYKTALPVPAISGYVRTAAGDPIECVAMVGLPGTPWTNSHGFYLAYVDSGDTVTVTPQKTGYTFTPPSRTHSDVGGNQENQDFTGSGAPSITVSPTSGLTTTEGGGTAVFSVALNAPPTTNVTIGISSSDTSEGTVSPSSLTFTPANWNTPQAVTVTGVDDALRDGNVAYTIVTAAAVSADGNYNGLDPANVSVTNVDDDTPGITVNPTSGLVTTESSGTAQFTIVLNSRPAADVTIGVASNDNTEGWASPASLTFTPANWNVPQTVTVTGVDDIENDGNWPYKVLTGFAVSADAGYDWLKGADVSVTNRDNEGWPLLGVTPTTTVMFPDTEAGQFVDSPAFQVTNTGGGRLTGSVTVGGAFRIVSGGTFDLDCGVSQVVGIRFAPTSGTTYTSTVTFTTNGGTATRSVKGTGTIYTVVVDNTDNEADRKFEAVSGIWASESARSNSWRGDYRTTATGDGSSVAAWTFQVRQDGLYEVSVWWPSTVSTWATAAPFRVYHAHGDTLALKDQHSNGGKWNSLGKFELWSGMDWRVELANNSPGATVVADAVQIKYAGALKPKLSLAPKSGWDFGLTRVGDTRAADVFTVTNKGKGRLIGQATVPAPFSIVSGGTFAIPAGASQIVRVAYSPAAEAIHTATVAFTTNAGNATPTVRGTALITLPPLLAVDPASEADMGRVTLGDSTELDAFTVRNEGDLPLTGTAAASAPFQIVSGSPYFLVPGASQTVRLRFTPTSEKNYSQTVSFSSNGGNTSRKVLGQGAPLVVDDLDNLADRRFAVLGGTWTPSSARSKYWASDYLFTPTGDGTTAAAWYFHVPSDGVYEVSAWWPSSTSTWGSLVPYTVYHRTGSAGFLKNQRSSGGKWNVLGRYEFTAADEWRVEISNNSPGSFVIADAVRVKWISALPFVKTAGGLRMPPAVMAKSLGILATPEDGPAPLDVLVEATNVPAGAACTWDFGDGKKAVGAAALHTYESPGLYIVTVTAGGQRAATAITVRDGPAR